MGQSVSQAVTDCFRFSIYISLGALAGVPGLSGESLGGVWRLSEGCVGVSEWCLKLASCCV